ncbi:MAG: hypothetical protein GY805_15705 [Chloroflexi bacterium]|nr:hypothetical protein [Chloroflexota bacterium]
MFPTLFNEEFLILLLTLGSIWFFLSTWHEIRQRNGEEQKKKGKRRRLKPQSPHDCELCSQGINLVEPKLEPRQVTPWSKIKHPAGRKKRVNSEGKACPHRCCAYYSINDMTIHALSVMIGEEKVSRSDSGNVRLVSANLAIAATRRCIV